MAKVETIPKVEARVPVTVDLKAAPPTAMQAFHPFENLRREVDRLFEDFTMNPLRLPFRRPVFDIEPFWQPESWMTVPAVDFVERDGAFEVAVDLPGLEEKNIHVKLAGGVLTIRGEKEEMTDDKKKDFHLRERRFGSFERSLRIPDTVDAEKIAAEFKQGVLKITLPKTAEAQKAKTIPVKAA